MTAGAEFDADAFASSLFDALALATGDGVGISAGVSYGALGSTHHSLHDLAALRAIHNITIVVPADSFETHAAVNFGIADEEAWDVGLPCGGEIEVYVERYEP